MVVRATGFLVASGFMPDGSTPGVKPGATTKGIQRVLLTLVPLLLLAGAAWSSDRDCLECHAEEEPTVDTAVLKRSVHKKQTCIKCHGDAEVKDDHDEEDVTLDAVNCVACHKKSAKDYDQSVHAEAARDGDEEAPTCSSCHGEHDIYPDKDHDSKINRFNLADTCAKCHEDEALTEGHELPKPSFIQRYRKSVHGRGVEVSGLLVSAVCTDCHGNHAIFSKDDEHSKVHPWNVPVTCAGCHEKILTTFKESAHGELWADHDDSGPVCITCHTAHGIQEPASRKFQLGIAKECGECHEDEAPTFKDNVHGQMYSLGYVATAKCSDCHTPHHNLPADDPRSSIHPANLQKTCGECHEKVTASYITYDPHSVPSSPEANRYVHWVWLFFVVLVSGTLGFFAIHYLLWAQRAWIGHWRGEFDADQSRPATHYVVRFNRVHRWVHGAMIVSFLTLALTGFSIKFSGTAWAQFVTLVLGGIETMRWIHRASAVISVVYTLVHFVYLANRLFRRKDWGILWGWQSMVPRLKDLEDFRANLKWFVYRGPAPALDRWAYWEKIEYLAELWGVPVITLSGLVLWFPEVATRFMPGWVINAAQVVHTYEAFLAVSYVVLFHYFVAHLRPDVFPMDDTIFTGKISLERLKAERPVEYARLTEGGIPGDVLVAPPTPDEIRRARVIGLIALTLGAAIMAGIAIGLFF